MKTINISSPVVLVSIVFLSLTTGCIKLENDLYLGSHEVWLQNSMFGPSTITVSPYTTVKWTNKDNCAHTVSSDISRFGSGNLSPGSEFIYTFTNQGIYHYHCSYHPMEKGIIIVQQ